MMKYHLKDDGNPGLCRAGENACPKGGMHFESEEEARAAVEQLFGTSFNAEPALNVYTKTAVKNQFKDFFTPEASSHYTREAQNNYLLNRPGSEAMKHIYSVYRLFLDSRLDVKAQNVKIQQELKVKLDELNRLRNGVKAVKRIDAAVALTYLSPILSKYYDIDDNRTLAQQEADAAYVKNCESEPQVLSSSLYSRVAHSLTNHSDEQLQKLAAYNGQNVELLIDDELEQIQALNPQASREGQLFGIDEYVTKFPFDHYLALKQIEATVAQIPNNALPYLKPEFQPNRLLKEKQQAREDIVTMGPNFNLTNRRDPDRSHSLFSLAAETLRIREHNRKLLQAVLES